MRGQRLPKDLRLVGTNLLRPFCNERRERNLDGPDPAEELVGGFGISRRYRGLRHRDTMPATLRFIRLSAYHRTHKTIREITLMQLKCPRCKRLIPASQLNVERDVAVCTSCDEAFVLSDLLAQGQDSDVDVGQPPPGAWFRETYDGWELGATTRTWAAVFLVPFAAVWSGGSLGGIYGSQIVHGKFNPVTSLIGLPFLIGSFFLWGGTLMAMFGKVTVSIAGDEGRTFTGVFGIGRRKRFDWSSIKSVKQETNYRSSSNNRRQQVIALERAGESSIRFGSMLNSERTEFVLRVLRSRLVTR